MKINISITHQSSPHFTHDDNNILTSNSRLMAQQSSVFDASTGYSDLSNFDDTQGFHVQSDYPYSQSYSPTSLDLQTIPEMSQEDYLPMDTNGGILSWEQLLGETSTKANAYRDVSQSDSSNDVTTSFGFQQQEGSETYNQGSVLEELNPEIDYETIIRSKHLYYDPNPEIVRKSAAKDSLVYTQNIMVRFLQPPPVAQGPLIIREVRPPQPPPPPPLVVRQRPPPPLSPPPIIFRERPPPIPPLMTAQVVTKTLPPIPPPPRSVIVEKLPAMPAKPRDIIIERWIPYESMHKRQVVVQRAEESQSYPPPRNVIITYEPVQTRIVRQFERLGVQTEDPRRYSELYPNSLLDTEQLLAQIRELGIVEDLSPPLFNHRNPTESLLTESTQHKAVAQDVSSDQTHYEDNTSYGDMNTVRSNYAPTYDNLVHGATNTSLQYDQISGQQFDLDQSYYTNTEEDLTTQLAQYGMTTDSIPY